MRMRMALNSLFPVRLLLFVAVFLFLILLPILSWNLQYSSLFWPGDRNYAEYLARRRGDARLGQADTYFRKLSVQNLLPYKYPYTPLQLIQQSRKKSQDLLSGQQNHSIHKYALSIVLMCHNRDTHEFDDYEPHYLTQTMHSLLHSLDMDVADNGLQWSNVSIHLCNVDSKPTECKECDYMQKILGQKKSPWYYADYISKTHPSENFVKMDCQARRQFAYCVKQAARVNPNAYVLLLEDDMISRVDTFPAIRQVLDSLHKRFPKDVNKRIGYVQLYTPQSKVHYDVWDISTWVEVFFLAAGLCFLLFACYLRIFLRPFRLVYNATFISLLMFLCAVFVICIGRPHWLNAYHAVTRSYHLGDITTEEFSSVLLTHEGADILSHHVDQQTCSQVELTKHDLVNQYLVSNQRQLLAVYPSVFHHVGLYSTFQRNTINPYHLDA